MNCSNCGAPLTPGQMSCPKCGLEFSQPVPAYLPPAPAPPERRNASVWPVLLLGCGGFVFVILILAAILFPVFAKAREKAREASCASNMKQMGIAFMQYSQDYDSKMPLAATWQDATLPYEMQKFSCPDVTAGTGYAYNSTLSNTKMKNYSDPSTVISAFESTKTDPNASDKLTSLVTPGRHSGGDNYTFLDGHIAWSTTPPSP